MINRYLRWSFLSALVGFMAGISAWVFLVLLDLATQTRITHPQIIWFLPLAGLAIGLAFHYFGNEISRGNSLILEEIHDPKNKIPLKMAPMILLGTVVTHLFGGSAGREGTAVQMGASLADQLSSFFKIEPEERKILLVAGIGAGFGAALGAPWAGVIFGMEVVRIGRLKLFAWFECLMASFTGYYVTVLLNAPHSVFSKISALHYELKTFLIVILFGILCGVVAYSFSKFTHILEVFFKRFISFAPLRPVVAGVFLVVLFYLEGSYSYSGLGLSTIKEAFINPTGWEVFLLKGFFTAVTVASGFKGGEFIPLVFIGATLGSALSGFFHIPPEFLGALGFVAVFAGAANTPLTCTLLAVEVFGFIACFLSYYFSGNKGIYSSQKMERPKHHSFFSVWKYFGELPNRFLKS